jgi:hypothetical protein
MHLHAFPVRIPWSIGDHWLAAVTVLEHPGQEAEGSVQADCQMSYNSTGKGTGKQRIISLCAGGAVGVHGKETDQNEAKLKDETLSKRNMHLGRLN